jgi:hypothetical protein
MIGSIIMIIYLVVVKPFLRRFDNLVEIYNETFVLLISIYYVILMKIELNVIEFRHFGIILNVTIGLFFASNMLLLLYETIIAIKKGI